MFDTELRRENRQHYARHVLSLIGASKHQDFFTLRTSQVEALLIEADLCRYRKPKNANGSRARYFYARIQRHAYPKE